MSDPGTSAARVGTGKVPVIFAFQPTHFEPATGDRLAEWERAMKDHVGLGKVDSFAVKAAGGSCLSWCGGQTPEAGNFPDDCDQLWHIRTFLLVEGGTDMSDPKQDPGIGPLPTIFMFQPKQFEIVTPDRLSEWEERMMNSVGFVNFKDTKTLAFSGSPTVSRCGDGNQVDECDYIRLQ
jgi:hypothetical protein